MRNVIKQCLQEEDMSAEELLKLIEEVEAEIEVERETASIKYWRREDAAVALLEYLNLNVLDGNAQVTIEDIYEVFDSIEKSAKRIKQPVVKVLKQEDFSDMLKRLGF